MQNILPMKANSVLWFIVLLIIGCESRTREENNFQILIENVNIVDTRNGVIINAQDIGINAGLITKIAPHDSVKNWSGTKTVEASGKYVIPGLWDMHVHFGGGDTLITANKNLLPLYIANGVTMVRDCAADISPSVLAWKKQVASGRLLGPNIFTSGPKLEGKNSIWPGDLEIATESELIQALDSLDRLQVDFVKVTDNALEPNLFLKSIQMATARGYMTSGHIPFELTIEEASEAGQRTVEHMSYMLKAASAKEEIIVEQYKAGKLDGSDAQELLDESIDREMALVKYSKLADNGTAVVPTLIGGRIISFLDENDHRDDTELQYLAPNFIKTYDWRINRANNASEEEVRKRKQRYRDMVSLLPLIQKSGMDIIAGTDAGFLNSFIYPGFSLHDELQIFVDGGLTPLEALRTSVVNGPKYFGLLDSYGSVEEGKVADLLLLNSDPTKSIKATKDIFMVVQRKTAYDKEELDGILIKVAETYR
jgi:imidazolonepropionase-like amidohydrolase|tara:strand:+ start:4810 stop:6255 length:1446 start_codon:yes stop_codon:yes gene_type:complete